MNDAAPEKRRSDSVLLPVMDLKGGVVVRGVGGRRDEYRAVESVLCDDPSPRVVAKAFREELGLNALYIADLDAIQGTAPPAFDVYRHLAADGARMMIDAGMKNRSDGERFLASAGKSAEWLSGLIVGMESLESADEGRGLADLLGDRMIFSLDLRNGKPLTGIDAWKRRSPVQIAEEVLPWGVRRMIVLDLARVGVRQGAGHLKICESLRKIDSSIELISGGGVRNSDDVRILLGAGCDRVLVASALHDGAIGRKEIALLDREFDVGQSPEWPVREAIVGS